MFPTERTFRWTWLALLGVALAAPAAPAADEAVLAARAKEIFRTRCLECHGGSQTKGGVKILDRDRLVARKKIVPGKPEESPLFELISGRGDDRMPPEGQPGLSPEDVEAVRRWLAAGAPAFPADVPAPAEKDRERAFRGVVGVDYVLKQVLAHVRTRPPEERRFLRYFSINHLLQGGATRDELDLHRAALAKAINHLSFEPTLVKPQPLPGDTTGTLFVVDIRRLGWQRQPFVRVKDGTIVGRSSVNLFDLLLLEYPYGVVYEDSDTYNRLVEEFLAPANQVRPIPYIRADWFVSVATLPPLYEDMLRLPFELPELEKRLGVDVQADLDNGVARRGGVAVSGVSHNNRVVERHPSPNGAYWKSFDYRSDKGPENIFKDPIDLHPFGGEFIFNLPNGLQGYFVANAQGRRLEFAPTEIVTDKFAEDRTVRNGLSCMRCHDGGMKGFTDVVRPAVLRLAGSAGFDRRRALQLYADKDEMDRLLETDADRFRKALAQVVDLPSGREPLVPVTHRFLDAPLQLPAACAELGLPDSTGLQGVFRSPQFTSLGLMPLASGGVVRRDLWEDYYDQVVRRMGLGTPVVPLDGLTKRDSAAEPAPFAVELRSSKKNNVFAPGDDLAVFVTNKSAVDLHVELIATGTQGEKVILVPAGTVLKPGQTLRHPPEGQSIKVRGGLGKEQVTVFACDREFPAGILLRGAGVTDRVIHPFYTLRRAGGQLTLRFDPDRVVKKTIEIETR